MVFYIFDGDTDRLPYQETVFVKDSIGTASGGISKEDSFIAIWIKILSLVSIVQNIAHTSKDVEVFDRGLLAFPHLITGLLSTCTNGHHVDDVKS